LALSTRATSAGGARATASRASGRKVSRRAMRLVEEAKRLRKPAAAAG